MTINSRMVERLLAEYDDRKMDTPPGETSLLKQLTKVILEQAIQAEIVQLSREERKGVARQEERLEEEKTVGQLAENMVPRVNDRGFRHVPLSIVRGKAAPVDINEKIISHHVRGMNTTEIQEHLKNYNGIEVEGSTISALTSAVAREALTWQDRPLEAVYPLVYVDVFRAKVRENGKIVDKMVYLIMAVTLEGIKDVLGMWVAEHEDGALWRAILMELKNRGVQDIFIACVDGQKYFPEVCVTIFPDVEVQLHVAQMVRNCLKFVAWKERKEVITDLKAVYQAVSLEQAGIELTAFALKWDKSHPTIVQYWRRSWERFEGLFAYPADIRKVIYTTNTMETLQAALCKAARDRRAFPDNALMLQQLHLTMQSVTGKWSLPVRDWKAALNRFSLLFNDRMPDY